MGLQIGQVTSGEFPGWCGCSSIHTERDKSRLEMVELRPVISGSHFAGGLDSLCAKESFLMTLYTVGPSNMGEDEHQIGKAYMN